MIDELELNNYLKVELEDLETFLAEDENEFLDEASKLPLEKRKTIPDSLFAVVITVKDKRTGEPRKIRKYPVDTPDRVRAALRYLGMSRNQATLRKLGINIDNVKQKILKRAKELNMKDLLEKYEKSTVEEQAKLFKETAEEVTKLKTDITAKDTEVTGLKASVTAKDTEIATLKADLDKVKKDADTATAEIAKRDKAIKDAEIAKRRTELGDSVKDMSDEDIMNEDKYKIAKLTKENADLKTKIPAPDPAKGSTDTKGDTDLDKGSKDKKKDGEIFATQKKVHEKAFGKEKKE